MIAAYNRVFGMCLGCLGEPVEPPNESSACFVTVLRVLMVVQATVIILNFIAFQAFFREGLFGLLMLFLLFICQRTLSHHTLMIFIFLSIFFALIFMVFFLTPLQNGKDLDALSRQEKLEYIVSIISFAYYAFCLVFCFYPYREFKAIEFDKSPLAGYFEREGAPVGGGGSPVQQQNQQVADYNPNYGNISYDRDRRNNQAGTFEVFKGQGVRIG